MRIYLVVALLAALASACGTESPGQASDDGYVPFGAAVDYVMPYATARDWVTYADHVVVATARSSPRPLSDLDPKEGGYIVGAVHVRVDQVLWSRPQARPLPPDQSFEIGGGGWIQYDSGRGRARVCDYACPEVGHRYVIALAGGHRGWYPFGAGACVNYDRGRIGTSGRELRDQFPSFVHSMWGKTAGDLRDRLAQTKPDPFAVKYMQLSVGQRYQKAMADRRASGKN